MMRDSAVRGIVFAVVACALLAACGSNQKELGQQQATQRWEALVRWSEFDALPDMMHPEWLAENPIEEADLDRLRGFRVTEYRVRQVLAEPDGNGFERLVSIRMYHSRTARERVINHREVWRYDEDLESWFLHSGIPDPRQ